MYAPLKLINIVLEVEEWVVLLEAEGELFLRNLLDPGIWAR